MSAFRGLLEGLRGSSPMIGIGLAGLAPPLFHLVKLNVVAV